MYLEVCIVWQEVNDPQYSAWEKCVELLYAHDKVVPRPKHRKLFAQTGDDDVDDNTDPQHSSNQGQPLSNKGKAGIV